MKVEIKINPRRAVAVDAGKGTRWLSRRLGKGGGTNYPGLVTQRIDPSALHDLAASVPNGCVFVTGTNGKTTTTRILTDAVRRSGLDPLNNREGSNMTPGVLTTLLAESDVLGTLRVSERTIGIFEIDEGHLLPAIKAVQPRMVLFTNLLRDQLDRYFEMDWTAHLWKEALKTLPETSVVVLNADDPQIADLADDLPNPLVYYGVEDSRHALPEIEHISDARRCLKCGTDLEYSYVYYAHLGHYSCPACGWSRPDPGVSAQRDRPRRYRGESHRGDHANRIDRARAATRWAVQRLQRPCSSGGGECAGPGPAVDHGAVGAAKSAFGRMERFTVDGKSACLALVKNPSGYNELLRLLLRR